MNFGRRGFPNAQETGKNGDSWFVATPEKQPVLVRSANPVLVERQVNHQMGIGNWQELIGMYSNILNHDGSVQTSTPTSGVSGQNTIKNGVVSDRNLNASRNTGSYVQNLSNDNAGRDVNNLAELLGIRNTEVVASTNGTWNQRITVSNRPANSNSNSHSYTQVASNRMEPEYSGLILAQQNYNLGSSHRLSNSSSYSQLGSNWLTPESTCLTPEKQNFTIGLNQRLANFNTYSQVAGNRKESESTGLVLTKQDCTLDSNQRLHHSSLTQLPDDGFTVPCWPNYNLNSPPRPELDAALSITSSFNFAPVTPDQAKHLEPQRVSEMLNVSLDESSSQERDEQWNLVTSTSGEVENHTNELSQIIADSASAVISTPLKEMNVLCNEGEQGINSNKTPDQKTPKRRRKHRPKVVTEGKPKRVQKAATPKTNGSSDKPSGKRKYVRKKGLKTPESQQENVNESILPTVESSQKSCRRALNFDSETINSHKSGRNEENNRPFKENNRPFNLNLNSDEAEMCTGINSISETSAGRIEEAWQKHSFSEKNQQTVSTCNLTCSTNQISSEYRLLTEQITPAKPPAKAKDHTLNAIARNMNMRNAVPGQTSLTQGYNQVHQHNRGEEINHGGYGADSISANFYRTRSLMLQNATQLAMATAHEKRGFKRAHGHIVEQMHPHSQNLMGSPILSQGNLYMGNPNSGRNNVRTIVSEAHQKMSSENLLHANISSIPSSTKAVRHLPKEVETGGVCIMYANDGTSQINGRLLNSWYGRDNSSNKNASNSAVNGTSGDWSIVPMATKPNFERQQASLLMAERVHQLKAHKVDCQQGNTSCDPKLSTNKKSLKPVSLNKSSRRAEKVLQQQQQNDALEDYKQSLLKARGKLRKQHLPVSVDEITNLLEGLHINGRNDVAEEKHALVPYKGSSTIVPYEGFDPIKKRKPRPKVDLDPETDRIWKLLMGSEGSESTEAADKDKEKWWEEERKVFRGRAESFIARMHLVQGDRRFSRWKGSVVDSVIGVFLTQNVSDHLSSSAFMSLAAKFPLQSDQNGTCVIFEDPIVQVVESNGSIDTLSSRTKSTDQNDNDGILTTAFNTSQHSLDPLGFRNSEEIRTTSRSSSRAEDRIRLNLDVNCNSSKNMFQMEKTVPADLYSLVNRSSLLDERPTPLHQQSEKPRSGRFNNLGGFSLFPSSISSHILHTPEPNLSSGDFQLHVTPESGLQNNCYFELPGDKNISSFAQTHSGITSVQSVNYMSRWIGNTLESNTPVQPNGVPSDDTPTLGPLAFLGKHPTQQGYLQPELHTGYNHHSTNNHKLEMNKMLHLERTNATKTAGSPAILENGSVSGQDKPKTLDNIMEANKKEEGSSLKPLDGAGTNIPHAKKGKAQGEKKTFDWDSLRKTAQSIGKRERSKEATDSLDYEALRCADVSEISNAIKERGMNNMLAERIKEFLNRLVTDHGSVDLEWLRDVPPDKAKDYLLSIRGLGLKSVECVRLLTLHQLAFPVDTNVGRIAVRLGWVPLQPLPESLQLHLLELYPILESIQKFLWPRLCTLDQQTLYELHYQMITFGKVFCTKSKPNCNACPMRGECRHFASAFASARLALPGPEEKSIVTSAVPIANDSTPMTPIKAIPLLQTDKDASIEAGLIDRRCEPIVEEPASPEREITELLESDIEDAFYEDPDEIPTIKLNIEEFTLNLQNYMQDNMELQEGDMSGALVALDPEAASIPTPKLKNVSRLRTEHQVYELPDSHPLLKGLDKREPDDPSPYLLAIWTPGETANSIQPPESRCEIHEAGQLCNDTTCFSCNNTREANSQTVRGTILIPCRTAMRGSFPLNGTYFQVNEMFADHESSLNPIDVPRSLIWNLPRRTVYFGTSVTSIFKGLPTEGIQFCFWKGFVCVRGFDQKRRAPRPLMARLHFPASKLVKPKK